MLDNVGQDLDALCLVCHLRASSYGCGELVRFAISRMRLSETTTKTMTTARALGQHCLSIHDCSVHRPFLIHELSVSDLTEAMGRFLGRVSDRFKQAFCARATGEPVFHST